jgi:hypothetical protein
MKELFRFLRAVCYHSREQRQNRRSGTGTRRTFYTRNWQDAGRRMWLLTFSNPCEEGKEGRMEKFGLFEKGCA